GPVVADERHAFARRQFEAHLPDGLLGAIALRDTFQIDPRMAHEPSCAAGGGATSGGRIRGALSITPPGCSAGNWDCAQRITWTAGLLTSSLAAGAVHSTRSMISLGR